jgi:hypothetical protein
MSYQTLARGPQAAGRTPMPAISARFGLLSGNDASTSSRQHAGGHALPKNAPRLGAPRCRAGGARRHRHEAVRDSLTCLQPRAAKARSHRLRKRPRPTPGGRRDFARAMPLLSPTRVQEPSTRLLQRNSGSRFTPGASRSVPRAICHISPLGRVAPIWSGPR